MVKTANTKDYCHTDNHDMCQPSLQNLSSIQWEQHAHIAYLFAQHVHQDLANIHSTLGMFDFLEHLQDSPETPLPPELQPDQVKAKSKEDIKQLIGISNDLILISQAANVYSYQLIHTPTVANLINDVILSHLTESEPSPLTDLRDNAKTDKIVALGDQLGAALAVFYFQWTPCLNEHRHAAELSVYHEVDCLSFEIPADDTESVASFARRLHSSEVSPIASIVEQQLSITTTELALWMARFIVMIHGGTVDANPNDPRLALRVSLPLMK